MGVLNWKDGFSNSSREVKKATNTNMNGGFV